MTGSRYLEGCLGEEEAQARWFEDKVEVWQDLVVIMARVAGQHPQTAYVDLQKSLQQEWDFVQHVTPGIGPAFQPVEDDMCD